MEQNYHSFEYPVDFYGASAVSPMFMPSIPVPSVPDGRDILFVGASGKITAYKMFTGALKSTIWRYKVTAQTKKVVYMHCIREFGLIVAVTCGKVSGVNAFTGEEVWKLNSPKIQEFIQADSITSITVGPLLFLGAKNHVICLNPFDGSLLWEVEFKDAFSKGTCIALLPTQYGLVTGCNGKIRCFDIEKGDLLWSNELKGTGYGPMSLLDLGNGTIVSGHNGYLCKISLVDDDANNVTRGYVIHRVGTGIIYSSLPMALILGPPGAQPEDLRIFSATSGQLQAWNPQDLKESWKNSLPGHGYGLGVSLAWDLAEHGMLYVALNGRVSKIDTTGNSKTVWTMSSFPQLRTNFLTLHAWDDQNVVVGSTGRLYAIGTKDGKLVWHENLEDEGMSNTHVTISSAWGDTCHHQCTIPQDPTKNLTAHNNSSQ